MEDKDFDLNELVQDFNTCKNDLATYESRVVKNARARFMMWNGQSEDQRKHGVDVFPYDGASDIRLPLIDENCKWLESLMLNSYNQAHIIASPITPDDARKSGSTSQFLRWLVKQKIVEMNKEVLLTANNLVTYGKAVVGVKWLQDIRRGNESFDKVKLLELVVQFIIQNNPPQDPAMLQDPDFILQVREQALSFAQDENFVEQNSLAVLKDLGGI